MYKYLLKMEDKCLKYIYWYRYMSVRTKSTVPKPIIQFWHHVGGYHNSYNQLEYGD